MCPRGLDELYNNVSTAGLLTHELSHLAINTSDNYSIGSMSWSYATRWKPEGKMPDHHYYATWYQNVVNGTAAGDRAYSDYANIKEEMEAYYQMILSKVNYQIEKGIRK